LQETFQQGEHLEHFHSYKSPTRQQDTVTASIDGTDETIDWHLDQGLALLFTPGLIQNTPSEGFFIRLPDGSEVMVHFEPQDEVVVLLGDGVNQYMNPILGTSLRPVPHALRMPKMMNNNDAPRIWYGRMVLPPPSAIHPVHQKTFGDLRDALMRASAGTSTTKDNHEETMALGCSSSSMTARHLNDNITCQEETQFFCWHACFNHTEEASPEACASQELDLACVNDARQLWDGAHDPAFYPGCVDLATAVTFTRSDSVDPASTNATTGKNHTNAATTGKNHTNATTGDKEEDEGDQTNDTDTIDQELDDTSPTSASFDIGLSRSVFGATMMVLVSIVVVVL
jgi:hypothetical protein